MNNGNVNLGPQQEAPVDPFAVTMQVVQGGLSRLQGYVQNELRPKIERRALVNDLEIPVIFQQLDNVIGDIRNRVNQKLKLTQAINNYKRAIEEVKALKLVNGEIEGKNEAERNARMLIVLQSDADYQAIRKGMDDAENDLQDVEADISQLYSVETMLRYKLRLAAAQLEYLSKD
ncbi:MAG: hypothetical protein M1343_13110 [Chloroflexi bacterium]|nr:hypothetical protein [Chloroflexota bacterium]MDA8188062.1 hypothetical protein [Dehalococcoidales bacterium]